MTTDFPINATCVVRKDSSGSHGKTLNLRIGPDGWHKESTDLTVEEAILLRAELDDFIKKAGKK